MTENQHTPILTGLRALVTASDRDWEVEVVPLVVGQRSVKEKEWLETFKIFGIGKGDGKKIIHRLTYTLLNEHEKLFGNSCVDKEIGIIFNKETSVTGHIHVCHSYVAPCDDPESQMVVTTYLDCRKQEDYGLINLWNLLRTSFDLSYLYMYLLVLRFNNVYLKTQTVLNKVYQTIIKTITKYGGQVLFRLLVVNF